MTPRGRISGQADMVDVRQAAALVGRHPETVRRWVWSGRLAARRQGNRLLVARDDLQALGRVEAEAPTLAEWADRARGARAAAPPRRGRSAADLVIEDRALRSGVEGVRARR